MRERRRGIVGFAGVAALVLAAGCGGGADAGEGGTAAGGGTGVGSGSLPPTGAPAGTVRGGAPAPSVVVVEGVGLQGPESALHDPLDDVYLVSNLAGDPVAADGNGFISRISPAGEVLALRWIDGTAPGVTLHAPRGMALRGDTLYVADVECVRRFLRADGTPAGEFCFPGSVFLNDVSASADGWVFVSDTGGEGAGDTVQALWAMRPGEAAFEPVARGPELGRPNGVLAAPRGVVTAASFADGRVYRYEYRDGRWTGPFDLWTVPAAMLDGLVRLDDGSLLVSSLESGALHRLGMDGSVRVSLPGLDSPADIGLDADRGVLLVPVLRGDRLEIHPLPPS